MDASEAISRQAGTGNEVDTLLETFRTEGGQRRDYSRWVKWTCGAIFVAWLIESIVDYTKGKPFDFGDLVIFSSLFGGTCAYGLTPTLRRAVTKAADLKDKRLLGGMIEAMDAGDANLKETLERASLRLLMQVGPDDTELLDEYQLDQLVKASRLSSNAAFSSVALRAIGYIGTNRTLQSLDISLNDPSLVSDRRSHLEPKIRAAMAELRIRLAKDQLSRGELNFRSRS